LERAAITRSLLSFTAASGRPTTMMDGSPDPVLTSISTSVASTPTTAAEKTRVIMDVLRIDPTGRVNCKRVKKDFERIG